MATPTPPDPGQVVTLKRTGGFAGLSNEWRFYADGRLVKNGADDKMLQPAQVEALLETIRAAGFFQLEKDKYTAEVCQDCFVYTVTVIDQGGAKQVVVDDASLQAAPGIEQVIRAILLLANAT